MRDRILSKNKDLYDIDARGREVYNHIYQGKSEKFFFEILQNSSDAYKRKKSSGEVNFTLHERNNFVMLEIRNFGDLFNSDDVDSICNTLKSSKSISNRKEYTGEFGVGFKKIFFLSDLVEIHSGVYHFKFDKEEVMQIKHNTKKYSSIEKIAWPLYPITIEGCYQNNCDYNTQNSTFFRIYIEKSRFRQSHPSTDYIHHPLLWYESEIDILTTRTLLFINEITAVDFRYIDIEGNLSVIRNLNRKSNDKVFGISSDIDLSRISSIRISDRYKNNISEEFFIVFKEWVDVQGNEEVTSEDLMNDLLTQFYYRGRIDNTEVGIAFQLEQNNTNYDLIQIQNGTLHQSLYSYEIFKELRLYLPFFVLCDVITDTTRDLIKDSIWNKYILLLIPDLFFDLCVPILENHPYWKYDWASCVYPRIYPGVVEPALMKIKKRIEEYPFLISIEDIPVRFEDAIIINENAIWFHNYLEQNPKYREIIKSCIDEEAFWIDPRCRIPNLNLTPKALFNIDINSYTDDRRSHISSDFQTLIKSLNQYESEEHTIILNEVIKQIYNTQLIRRSELSKEYKIWNMEYIPTIDNELISLKDEIYVLQNDDLELVDQAKTRGKKVLSRRIKPSIFDKDQHPKIYEGIFSEINLENNFKELKNTEDLFSGIDWLDDISEGWDTLSDRQKMNKTRLLLSNLNNDDLDKLSIHQLSFFELKCINIEQKQTEWVNIRNPIFLTPQNSDKKLLLHYIKLLGEKYILDEEYYNELKTFNKVDNNLTDNFLRKIGIRLGTSLSDLFSDEVDKITEELARIKYEKLNYNVVRPSEKTWDWKVSNKNETFYLEVKYRSTSTTVEFSYNQSSKMNKHVKVIFYNSLDNPIARLFHGEDIVKYAQKHLVLSINLSKINQIK